MEVDLYVVYGENLDLCSGSVTFDFSIAVDLEMVGRFDLGMVDIPGKGCDSLHLGMVVDVFGTDCDSLDLGVVVQVYGEYCDSFCGYEALDSHRTHCE